MNETPMKSKSSKSRTITKTLKNAGFLHIGNYDDLDYFVIPKSGRLLLTGPIEAFRGRIKDFVAVGAIPIPFTTFEAVIEALIQSLDTSEHDLIERIFDVLSE